MPVVVEEADMVVVAAGMCTEVLWLTCWSNWSLWQSLNMLGLW